jgi:hypothetical protein
MRRHWLTDREDAGQRQTRRGTSRPASLGMKYNQSDDFSVSSPLAAAIRDNFSKRAVDR